MSGILIDLKGIWYQKCYNLVLFFIGNVMLIFMRPTWQMWLYLVLPLQLVSQIGVNFATLKMIDLDPKNRGLWTNGVAAGVSIGTQIFLILRTTSRPDLLWVMYLCFIPFCLWRTFMLCPKSNDISNGVGWKTRYDQVKKINFGEKYCMINQDSLSFKEKIGLKFTALGNLLKVLLRPHLILLAIWFIAADFRNETSIVDRTLCCWVRMVEKKC